MEQSLGNNESHPTPQSKQIESDLIRAMLIKGFGIELVEFIEQAPFDEIDTQNDYDDPWDDEFSDLPDEDADWLYDEGMKFLGLTGDEDEQGLSDSFWD